MSSAKPGPSQPRKRKAGGEGKKGKVFLEGKDDLLSLISNVTSSKEAITQSRLDKQKAAISEHPPSAEKRDAAASKKKLKSGSIGGQEKKSAKRERALEEAKEKILQRQKEKKARLKQRANGGPSSTDTEVPKVKKKKSVGFA